MHATARPQGTDATSCRSRPGSSPHAIRRPRRSERQHSRAHRTLAIRSVLTTIPLNQRTLSLSIHTALPQQTTTAQPILNSPSNPPSARNVPPSLINPRQQTLVQPQPNRHLSHVAEYSGRCTRLGETPQNLAELEACQKTNVSDLRPTPVYEGELLGVSVQPARWQASTPAPAGPPYAAGCTQPNGHAHAASTRA